MYSALPGDNGEYPPFLGEPSRLSDSPPPLFATPFRETARAGAGVAPPSPSETPFCAGRVEVVRGI